MHVFPNSGSLVNINTEHINYMVPNPLFPQNVDDFETRYLTSCVSFKGVDMVDFGYLHIVLI